MRADADVVADLDLVVEADVLFEDGVLERAAIDGGVGADLAVVADHHATELRHLQPAPAIHRQAETIGAKHRARMHAHAPAEADARHQGDAGDQFAAFADVAIVADHATRADHRAGADLAAGADRRRAGRCEADGSTEASAATPRSDGCLAACDERGSNSAAIFANVAYGIRGDQGSACEPFGVFLAHHHDTGVRRRKLAAIFRIGEEGQLLRPGARTGCRRH